MKTLSLTDFLIARIEEQERRDDVHRSSCVIDHLDGVASGCTCDIPARVAAECAAKRALLVVLSDVEWHGSYAVRDVALGILARPHSAHPDFNPEWRA